MDHLKARFYDHVSQDIAASKVAGTKIYNDVLMVELSVIGSKGESISHIATDQHKADYPHAWAEYSGEKYTGELGTPLSVLGEKFTPARQAELRSLGIYTVEQLSKITDGNAMKLREGLTAKNAANKYLEGAALAKREVTIDQFEDMQRRIAELEQQNSELSANQKMKPGRKANGEDAQIIM